MGSSSLMCHGAFQDSSATRGLATHFPVRLTDIQCVPTSTPTSLSSAVFAVYFLVVKEALFYENTIKYYKPAIK